MRRHASAATAGSTKRQAFGLVAFVRGVLATRPSTPRVIGRGATSPGRAHLASLIIVAVASLALSTAGASASITHATEPFSPLTGAPIGMTFGEPSAVTIDESTGNVFVTDATGERVVILGADGGAPVGLAQPYEIGGIPFGGNNPAGLVYDNVTGTPNEGTLYAFDPATMEIEEFVRDPISEKFVLNGEIAVQSPGDRTGQVGAGLAIDRAGDLFIGIFGFSTPGNVYKYSPSGALLKHYELPVSSPDQVAVDDAGDLFVQELAGPLLKFPAGPAGEIDPSVYTEVAPRVTGVAYDPGSNDIYVPVNNAVVQYDAATLQKISEFGTEVLTNVRATEGLAVDSKSGRIYVANFGADNVTAFGPAVSVPTTTAGAATEITGTKATLNGSVNPEGIAVTECFFEWGKDQNGEPHYEHIVECETLPPTNSEPDPVSAKISGLASNGALFHFRLITKNENGEAKSLDKSLETARTTATEAADGVGAEAAILHGALRPEGRPFTSCVFEYGVVTSAGFEKEANCTPGAAEIEPDFAVHPVSLSLSNLRPNATYKFRVTTIGSEGQLSGQILTFTTQGPPQVGEIRAVDANQSSVTLEAKINPSGFGTSYHFEWGPTVFYGNSVPVEFEPFVGSGETPVSVKVKVGSLSAGTTYHFRVVATNSVNTTESPDQIFETLNTCELPEGRCFELVSPRDAGPVSLSGTSNGAMQHFHAADGPGSLAYIMESGLPDATKGTEVLYLATRGANGWTSTQIDASVVARGEVNSPNSTTSLTRGLSENLTCSVVESGQPLTEDASSRLIIEAGGENLYRKVGDNYTAITKLAPENLEVVSGANEQYLLRGISRNCAKVVFFAPYQYPGVPGFGSERLYEWEEGILRNVSVVPGPGGEEVAVEAKPGPESNEVSEEGDRVFFAAERQTSPNVEEIGKIGVFVRENGAVTHDVSLSETAVPDEGATFQSATKDGSRVFFTANAGLTEESSAEGTDLYEYNLESRELVDLSVDRDQGGAEVGGFIGASEDGTHVYFLARGQLAPGSGRTLAENESANTYSIYSESGGKIGYVGIVGGEGQNASQAVGRIRGERPGGQTARVSPDGRYLLFESTSVVTGYEPGQRVPEAYLYDADASADATLCVSCRQDGKVSSSLAGNHPLESDGTEPLYQRRTLVESAGQPRVVFTSFDDLATGAVEGDANLYEWTHGQVFLVATEPPGLEGPTEEVSPGFPSKEAHVIFGDVSPDGSDMYFATPQTLSWEDSDGRFSIYDARIGGGFPKPPPAAAPCEPTSEGSCQGPPSVSPPPTSPGSTNFVGPGNGKPKSTKKPVHKKHHKKRHTKKHRAKRHKGKKKRSNGKRQRTGRPAKSNGRAGK